MLTSINSSTTSCVRQGRDESSDRLSGLGEILAQSHVLVLVGFGVYSTGFFCLGWL